jgi:hypothetical protein
MLSSFCCVHVAEFPTRSFSAPAVGLEKSSRDSCLEKIAGGLLAGRGKQFAVQVRVLF